MTRRSAGYRQRLVVALVAAGTLFSAIVLAQPPPPGGGPPPPGGPGMGHPPFGGPPHTSAVNIPLSILESGLKLTDDQKTKIGQLQQQFHQQVREQMPRPGGPPDGQPGGPPDPETMRAAHDKIRNLEQQTNGRIEAALTSSQKQALPNLIKTVDAMRMAGVPAEIYSDLTAEQRTKIAAIGQDAQQKMKQAMEKASQSGDFEQVHQAMQQTHQQIHQKVMAVLTDDQRKAVEKFQKEHPHPGPGGPGGPGGPPPGGPPPGDGGPPPPDGAGPPPPDSPVR